MNQPKIRTLAREDNAQVASIIRTVMPEFGASGAGFAIHIKARMVCRSLVIGGHHNEMQVEYLYVRDLDCPSVR